MMSNRVLLDTNAVSDVMNGFTEVLDILRRYESYAVPAIVMGELYFMVENSARKIENLARVEAFLDGVSVLPVTQETAKLYVRIRVELKRKGRPIPLHDYWVAATALEHKLPLLTRDSDFFDTIDDLQVVYSNSPFPPKA